ncbi:MAG: hypothetical protein JWQ38_3692 [Flavipsychrobacter sp.]|nr:hypothetical protein [Flavipsychrobacter sp.]
MKALSLLLIDLAACVLSPAQGVSFFRYYNAPFPNAENNSYSVIQTRDLGYLFTGVTPVQTGPFDFEGKMMLFKTDAVGDTQWVKKLDLPDGCPDANGYVVRELNEGYLVAGACTYTLILVRTDIHGDTLWTRHTGHYVGTDVSMQLTPDGGCIVAGTTSMTNDSARVIKFDNLGHEQWTRTYKHWPSQRAADIRTTTDGGYMLLTNAVTFTGLSVPEVFKLDAVGDTMWTAEYLDTGYVPVMKTIIQTADGGYMVSGGIGSDGQLMKLRADGSRDWSLMLPHYPSYGVYEDTAHAWYSLAMEYSYKIGLQKITYSGSSVLWSRTYGTNAEYATDFAHTQDGGFILTGYGRYMDNPDSVFNILVRTDAEGVLSTPAVHHIAPEKHNISVYPNPATTILNITSPDKINGVIICNVLGQELFNRCYNTAQVKVDIASIPAGVYIIKVNGSEVKRFVKQ